MVKIFLQKFTATLISTGMLLFGLPIGVIASEISGVNPTGNVYNIEPSKIGGSTGFREYDKFNKCSRCKLLAYCRGCPAVAKGTNGSFYMDDPQCWASEENGLLNNVGNKSYENESCIN